jgi:predicted SnoaL-like aldol condensation-catalyzing enzyme
MPASALAREGTLRRLRKRDEHIMPKHKESATSFLEMAGTGKVQEAYDRFVAPSFIHHNQYFKGDRQSLLVAMQEASKTTPNKSIEIKHVYEDGDTVITHSLVTRHAPQAPDIAVIHIFRFEDARIAELWDVGQPISKDSPNENGMF